MGLSTLQESGTANHGRVRIAKVFPQLVQPQTRVSVLLRHLFSACASALTSITKSPPSMREARQRDCTRQLRQSTAHICRPTVAANDVLPILAIAFRAQMRQASSAVPYPFGFLMIMKRKDWPLT